MDPNDSYKQQLEERKRKLQNLNQAARAQPQKGTPSSEKIQKSIDEMTLVEILRDIIKPQLATKFDALMIAVHCIMLKQGFLFVGEGDSPLTLGELPPNWNKGASFNFKYKHPTSTKKYSISGVSLRSPGEEKLVIRAKPEGEDRQYVISLDCTTYMKEDSALNDFANIFNNIEKLNSEIFEGITEKLLSTVMPSTAPRDHDPLRVPGRGTPQPSPLLIGQPMRSPIGGFGVGDHDMHPSFDPFGFGGYPGGGGGNLIGPGHPGFGPTLPFPGHPNVGPQPPRPGRPSIPKGSVPPGARYDPFGPPTDPTGQGNPDYNHLPPPGYDDMFL